jgi:hypothetical protein
MDKANPPTSFGVFKPVGHTVIAFFTEEELQSAVLALKALGFQASDMVHYSGVEMAAQVDAELQVANPWANVGTELDLMRGHWELAKKGCSFLVVEAASNDLADQVTALVHTIHPASALRYRQLIIEDLTAKPPGRMGEGQAD